MREPQLLDQLIERYSHFDEAQLADMIASTKAAVGSYKFIPNPGPQTAAWDSLADLLLYGGEGGGGKSGLLVGLALVKHDRSLLMRKKYSDLGGLTDDTLRLNGTKQGYNGSNPPKLRTSDDRLIEYGAAQHEGDELAWMGRPHDFLGIDEAWQFSKKQIRTLMGWVRTIKPGQRCRTILATNPPLSSEGAYLVEMFAPWLDPHHPNPAKQGELRWYITEVITGGNETDYKDHEVSGPGQYVIDGDYIRPATEEEIDAEDKKALHAMSRTFIRASVRDNPFLRDTDYQKMLDSLPEPVRSSVRDGNFMAARKDDDWQVIPSAWVTAAQGRWTSLLPKDVPMCAMGVDATGGGACDNVIAPRYDGYYPPVIVIPGKDTPQGDGLAGHILKNRRDMADIGIDMDGGWGNVAFVELRNNEIDATSYKGSEGSTKRTKDNIYGYVNKRACTWWQFREALDPTQPGGSPIMLPPDPLLVAELTSVRYSLTTHKGRTCIILEEKAKATARLGRSPDRADAVTISWQIGPKIGNFRGGWEGKKAGKSLKVNIAHTDKKRR